MNKFKLNVWLAIDWERWEESVQSFAHIELPFLPRKNDTFNYRQINYEVIEVNYYIDSNGRIDKQNINLIVAPYAIP